MVCIITAAAGYEKFISCMLIMAPGMDPIPPRTAATKALIPSMEPMVGLACV